MASKLITRGNYIIVEDTITGKTSEFPKDKTRYEDEDNHIVLYMLGERPKYKRIELSDIVDSSGIPFADLDAILSWLQINTGALKATLENASIVLQNNIVDESNSTQSLLGGNGVFTGEWFDTLYYGTSIVSISTDKDSAIDGLEVQYSNDTTHIDQDDKFTIKANIGKVFTFGMANSYFRIKYTNGTVAQTHFDIQVIHKSTAIKNSSHRIIDSIAADDDAELMKSVITGQRDDGIFANAMLDNENNLRVNSFPYLYGISEGAITGHNALLKFGTRTTLAANTQSTIWEGNTALYQYLTTAQQLKVSSSSANDTALGTGARIITIFGLDANWNEISEDIIMNGVSIVTTVNSYLRIYRAFVTTCGTSYSNEGKITIRNNANTVEQCVITANDGQTLMALWTVPMGRTAYMLKGTVSTDSNKGARVSFFTRRNDNGAILYPWQIKYRAFIFGGENEFVFDIPFKIPEKTDISVRVTTPASAGTTSAGATFELWYED